MNKTLQMLFTNEEGRTVTISVVDPKDNLTEAQVAAAMQTLLEKNVFISTGGALVAVVGARIVSRGVEPIFPAS